MGKFAVIEYFSRWNLHYRIIHSYRIFHTMEFIFSNNSQLIVSFTRWNSLSRIIHSYKRIFLKMEFTFSNNSQLSYLSQAGIYFLE